MRPLLAIALLGLIALALAGPRNHSGTERRVTPPVATTTPEPPELRPATLDRQDRVSRARRRAEAQIFDARPLLSRLPATRAGVHVDVGGLAPDDRTTIFVVDAGSRTRAHARAVVAALLRHAGDRGDQYQLEWAK